MLPLQLGPSRARLRVLCLGAHSDDIEIGCAGTLLRWLQEYRHVEVTLAVLSAADARGSEARRSARALLGRAATLDVVLADLEDAHFPAEFRRAKAFMADLRHRVHPDIVLTHRLEDRHQDHRMVAELSWQSFRDHLIFEYEVPKYEGDLGHPNVFVPLPSGIAARKVRHLLKHFGSQRSKTWFTADTFQALMRLRGVECRAPSGLAEAFSVRKALL
ncbi:MAG TPA: PIG-L deacetylase family protein [Burkholderiaceae bacterium]|nr:PIG-L deacetylase family protein [Burkholderiaceae bacterium]